MKTKIILLVIALGLIASAVIGVTVYNEIAVGKAIKEKAEAYNFSFSMDDVVCTDMKCWVIIKENGKKIDEVIIFKTIETAKGNMTLKNEEILDLINKGMKYKIERYVTNYGWKETTDKIYDGGKITLNEEK